MTYRRRRRADAIIRRSLTAILMLLPVVVLPFLVLQAGPAWSAHLGHGQRGIFTAYDESCNRSCNWYGTFSGDEGLVKNDVMIADGTGVSGVGAQIPAVYTGGSGVDEIVFPVGGGSAWIDVTFFIGLAAAGVAADIAWLILRLRRARRRRGTLRGPGVVTSPP